MCWSNPPLRNASVGGGCNRRPRYTDLHDRRTRWPVAGFCGSRRSREMDRGHSAPSTEPSPVVENIAAVAGLEAEALQRRTAADRASDAIAAFVGTIGFVALHLVWFALWASINAGLIPFIPAFDPYPFQLLCMIVSMEGVLMSTFVLIKQNRMGYLSDRRAQLDLQVNLLAEREITRLLQITGEIARRVGVTDPVLLAGEMAEETKVEKLVTELDRGLAEEE